MAYTVLKLKIKQNKTKNPAGHLFGGTLFIYYYMMSVYIGHGFFSLYGLNDDKNMAKKQMKIDKNKAKKFY